MCLLPRTPLSLVFIRPGIGKKRLTVKCLVGPYKKRDAMCLGIGECQNIYMEQSSLWTAQVDPQMGDRTPRTSDSHKLFQRAAYFDVINPGLSRCGWTTPSHAGSREQGMSLQARESSSGRWWLWGQVIDAGLGETGYIKAGCDCGVHCWWGLGTSSRGSCGVRLWDQAGLPKALQCSLKQLTPVLCGTLRASCVCAF